MKCHSYPLLVGLVFVLSTNIYSMDTTPDKETFANDASVNNAPTIEINLDEHYDATTKTLNLSGIPLSNRGLRHIFGDLKKYIEDKETHSLILENVGLTKAPFALIGFATVNKALKHISLKKNIFKQESQSDFNSIQNSVQQKGLFKTASNLIAKAFSSKIERSLILEVDFAAEPIYIIKGFEASNTKLLTIPVLMAFGFTAVCFAPQLANLWVGHFPGTCDSQTLQALVDACNLCAANVTGV